MLGHKFAVRVHGDSFFGEGQGRTVLDNVNCIGTEDNLENCEHNGFLTEDCDHTEDAGVVCVPF